MTTQEPQPQHLFDSRADATDEIEMAIDDAIDVDCTNAKLARAVVRLLLSRGVVLWPTEATEAAEP